MQNILKLENDVREGENLNVCFSVDENEAKYVSVVAKSILNSVKPHNREKIYFGVLCEDKNTEAIINSSFSDCGISTTNFQTKVLKEEERSCIVETMRVDHNVQTIKNVMNFARFYLPEHFKHFENFLYLDVDVVVKIPKDEKQDNDFYEMILKDADLITYPLCAVPMPRNEHSIPYVASSVSSNYKFFNAGVYRMTISYWFENKFDEKFKEIMIQHKKSEKPLFKLGTQPILNILYLNRYKHLDEKYNTMDLGWKTSISQDKLDSAFILHWSGASKGWNPANKYKKYWENASEINI